MESTKQEPITEEQESDQIAAEAYAEMEGEPKKKEEPKEEPKETPPEKPEESEAEPKEPEEDDSKPSEKEPEEEKPEKSDEEQQKEDEEVRSYALEKGITRSEAQEQLGKDDAIVAKYKSPKELARAYRETQSGYDKLRVENEKLKKEVEEGNSQIVSQDIDIRIDKFIKGNREGLLEEYKRTYPNKSENMTDEAILEDLRPALKNRYNNALVKKQGEIKEKAMTLRSELIDKISDSDREFLPEIKVGLKKLTDAEIVSENFSFQDIVYWAKGQRYDEDVKKAEARATKRAKEEVKILGEKVPSGDGQPVKKGKGTPSSLNQDQKDRATEMFPDISEKEAIKEYIDTFKDELKENPSFIG